MNYQHDYSINFPTTKDMTTRQRKAAKILRALVTHLGREDLRGLKCLDLGCSVGIISRALADSGANIIGIDIDRAALQEAASQGANSAAFATGDVGATPFPADTFDVLICSQVYEHSPSLTLLVREIHRVLKQGGVCFFSGPNRWAIMEEHYNLPFLSWLPKAWADRYVRWSGRANEYYENPRSAGALRSNLADFAIFDLNPDMIRYPELYAMEPEVGRFKYVARLVPDWFWKQLGSFVPNFNWILVKSRS